MAQKKIHVFEIDHYSETDEFHYRGTFSCRRMSIQDYSKMQVAKSRLNGGMHYVPENPGVGVDAATEGLNNMIAQLEVSLINSPDWWDLGSIGDIDLLGKVYSEVVKFENSFRAGNSGENSEGRGSAANKATLVRGHAAQMVGEEVPDSLQP